MHSTTSKQLMLDTSFSAAVKTHNSREAQQTTHVNRQDASSRLSLSSQLGGVCCWGINPVPEPLPAVGVFVGSAGDCRGHLVVFVALKVGGV